MTIEEIQELLAEFENRISFLENCLPYKGEPEKPPDKEIQVIHRFMYSIAPPLKKGKYIKYT